ncbi:MAG: serine/threonine protein kinase [Solirubrobacteraceae bacterium]
MSTAQRRVGRYEIVRQIGQGGMATVYLARQEGLDRDVALKELSSFQASAPDMVQRFLRESRLAGSLNHPNVVTVHEYFEEGSVPYIAMEYLPRGSLRPYVGRLSPAQFAGVMEGVLAGLAHAEAHGIVHRDMKPENLLITSDGRVKIADFGIAKATVTAGGGTFLTKEGVAIGTPTYMAPEQAIASSDIGPWTDLYSVGIIAYEQILGRPPFRDEAPPVILFRHVNDPVPPATKANPAVDPAVSAWIDRLLTKDPHSRPRDAARVWEDLEEIVLGTLGPLWRREARISGDDQAPDTPKPLTPAPFESEIAPPPEVATGVAETGYVTFGGSGPQNPPSVAPVMPSGKADPVKVERPTAEAEPTKVERPTAEGPTVEGPTAVPRSEAPAPARREDMPPVELETRGPEHRPFVQLDPGGAQDRPPVKPDTAGVDKSTTAYLSSADSVPPPQAPTRPTVPLGGGGEAPPPPSRDQSDQQAGEPRRGARASPLGLITLCAVAALAVGGVVAVLALGGSSSSSSTMSTTTTTRTAPEVGKATAWLSALNAGNSAQAASFWKTPATIVPAFPHHKPLNLQDRRALTNYFTNNIGCITSQDPPSTYIQGKSTVPRLAGDTVHLRIYPVGRKLSGRPCQNLRDPTSPIPDSYDYYLKFNGEKIAKWASQLAPAGVAREWVKYWNEGTGKDSVSATQLWEQSSEADLPGRPNKKFTQFNMIADWSRGNGCALGILPPVRESASAVTFDATVTGSRPGATPCTLRTGQRLSYKLQVQNGRIAKLVETQTG